MKNNHKALIINILIAFAFFVLLIVFSYYFFEFVYRVQLLASPCELCLKHNPILTDCFKNSVKYTYDFKDNGANLDKVYNLTIKP